MIPRQRDDRVVLVTGGAGFVGCNLAHRLLEQGCKVRLFDNLSRPGTERNLAWLTRAHGGRFELVTGDMRDRRAVEAAMKNVAVAFHLAAQVAVTTSLSDPSRDFEINARGTLHLLEAARSARWRPAVVYTSTNKVYGDLGKLPLVELERRYQPGDARARAYGIDEQQHLELHSPYGCSKGAADQYVLDFARCYRLPAVVFRMSCIYGPHQYGNEDQGWVAHFLMRAIQGETITIYGDGKQVRDLLHVDDLTDALCRAADAADGLAGRAFNIGGGPGASVSLLELCERITRIRGARPHVEHAPWRASDQRWYVSDTAAFQRATGWAPAVDVDRGLAGLHTWLEGELAAMARERWVAGSDVTMPRGGNA